ncbi:MAG: hypothetical protein IPM36_17255 [Lewinellaceae bacterium]|nr:hypothetical protein [Lewinellaceae bacterium]
MNENKKIKYTLWIAVIGLLTVIVSQWNVLFPKPKKEETQHLVAQPNINVINKIKIDNKAQSNNTGNLTKSNKNKESPSPERLKESEPAKIEAENKVIYSSEVKDENGKGIADVEVYCPNCIVKKVKTDNEGHFDLEGYFDKNAAFWQSTLTISKDKKSKTETIDWREKSPQPINF